MTKQANKAFAVILAGGKGERFWPLSTSKHPKQFLSLVGDEPLLAQAIDRLEGLIPPENVLVITNGDLVDVARKSAPKLPAENVIGEPMGRDTAAAIALGAAIIEKRCGDGVFAVLTADHIIGDLDIYKQTLSDALALASEEEVLITIGITPDEPSTGYGYIESGDSYRETETGTAFLKANRFVEKPNRSTAEKYLETGRYYWNSGMFIWSTHSIRKAFEAFRPPLSDMMDALKPVMETSDFDEHFKTEYEKLEKISIDYAVMEKADNVLMARGTFSWDDVGSWPALENHFESDLEGNVVIGEAAELDGHNNIIVSKDRLTAVIGLQDLVVVQAKGATLICPKDRAQDIKKIVHKLRDQGGYEDLL
jgi:mannose-1-phosphate guanylyltransferase